MLNQQVAIGVLMVLSGLCTSCHAETESDANQENKSVTIPLDQIWAYRMPGTQDVEALDGLLVTESRRAIGFLTPDNKQTRSAFAVLGTELDALREAHSVFTKKSRHRKTFPAGSDVSIVFFSAEFGRYVHIDLVERQDNVVRIHYRFVPHKTKERTKHLALIPLGKLAAGKYRVKMIRSPMKPNYVIGQRLQSVFYEKALRIVGNSFSFFVGPQPTDQGSNQEGGEIYLDEIWGCNMPRTLDFRKLDGALFGEIGRAIWTFSSTDHDTRAGFAVRGSGVEALRHVHSVLVENKRPQRTFSTDSKVSVFFFSPYEFNSFIHLHRVERKGKIINIRYRFAPNETEENPKHFALIPLGKLPPGEYRVNMIQSPMEHAYAAIGVQPISNEDARRSVCESFSFSISAQGK